ncbi:hypothetical protein BCR39DRAFT_542355 [Naematelia encephala]|uniref:EthD domain-containing protein n=1 Tax=Naematelia encephala TaxID=71784 RepID=A0A1Y2AV11_9TREE|nr:hypothetical protein BCR39DRAFT_542355 [Naematelia encephala]
MAVRISLLLKKLDTLTYEEFHAYWEGTHANIFLDCPVIKDKVVKFTQFHFDRTLSATLAAQGTPILDFDGQVDIYTATFEDLQVLLADPEYQSLVVSDAALFSKFSESKIMIGYDKDFILDGKRV